MNSAKIAVSIPADVLRLAKKKVAAGRAKSLSAFVSEAVDEKVRRDELAEILGPDGRRAWGSGQGGDGMGKASPPASVLEAGALIAFERGDERAERI